jgi:hypothetical protein
MYEEGLCAVVETVILKHVSLWHRTQQNLGARLP